ncbi:tripartite tricarboxylate transporter TctB family protein [Natronobacterium texcoconense]|uniref:Tripartite tricarboxylate transporter TctB family protein n=1 Tax=Natronobacterium texcoconense TaxID=1095778 RepID=A0A1H1H1E8_NATTX|nr:tripartite tricarboxylate transporter TctB family protein [Natronobacterium texcoconense]SDR19244.1 Tripartite tricarboxylate transporter TctB family protein [Natronobacterium texcoconense]
MSIQSRSEAGLLVVFLAVAVVFVALTATFDSGSATLFPRLTGAIVIVGVALIAFEDYLPPVLQRVVAEPVDLVDQEEFETTGEDDGKDRTEAGEERLLTSRQFLYGSITGYVGLAYVVSVLIATPIFVAAYAYWNDQRPLYAAVLIVVSIGICFAFISLANAPLDRGLLLPRGVL